MKTRQNTETTQLSTRIVWTAGLCAFWASGYFFLGFRAQAVSTFDPSTSLDAFIPFIGWAVWPYLLGIVWIALPASVVRASSLFTRTATAYALTIGLSFLCFTMVPTNAVSLRDYTVDSHLDRLTAYVLRAFHTIDPPTNLLPSLHVSLATVATAAIVEQYTRWKGPAFGLLAIVVASVCVSKQHTILDAVSGFILALGALVVSWRQESISTQGGR